MSATGYPPEWETKEQQEQWGVVPVPPSLRFAASGMGVTVGEINLERGPLGGR